MAPFLTFYLLFWTFLVLCFLMFYFTFWVFWYLHFSYASCISGFLHLLIPSSLICNIWYSIFHIFFSFYCLMYSFLSLYLFLTTCLFFSSSLYFLILAFKSLCHLANNISFFDEQLITVLALTVQSNFIIAFESTESVGKHYQKLLLYIIFQWVQCIKFDKNFCTRTRYIAILIFARIK